MSKIKELAEQMFPEPQMVNYDDILEYRNDRDWTIIARGAVVKGYEQAQKDLELSWRDMQHIVKIADHLCNSLEYDKIKKMGEEGYYTEILERFNKEKYGNTQK